MAKLQRAIANHEFSSSVRPTHIWFDGECQEAMWNYQHVLKSSHRVITSRTPSKNAPQWSNVRMFLFEMQNEGVVSLIGKKKRKEKPNLILDFFLKKWQLNPPIYAIQSSGLLHKDCALPSKVLVNMLSQKFNIHMFFTKGEVWPLWKI